MEEPVYAGAFLDWCYNSRLGRWTTEVVLRRTWVSRLYGWLHDRPGSKRKIRPFATALRVNMGECLRPLDEYVSFNDFFTREIDLSKRPMCSDERVCVAPADGKVLAFTAIDPERIFPIKRSMFNLERFIGSEALAKKYAGGSLVIVRLHLSDYHHFHFPDSGIPGEAVPIAGKLYSVTPYARDWFVPFYSENYRMRTLFASDHFGQIVMVEIGGFTVGSIRQCYACGNRVAKGAKKGFFELGGSTVVLLFEAEALRIDEDLCAKTGANLETYVRLGEPIGRL
ncbi:MAG: archaetidylserine decarboxylase [Deltaproteobacteria bacterium]|nr:archaetidylserine decarboxylase [Deltaproteobacteria bacterium]